MLAKARREFDRLLAAQGRRNEQSDHAINAAVTLWHLAEWIWHYAYADLGSLQGELVDSLSSFQRVAKQICPALAACEVVAVAFKHGGRADEREGRPLLAALNYDPALIDESTAKGARALIELLNHPDQRPTVEIDGVVETAAEIIRRSIGFWQSALARTSRANVHNEIVYPAISANKGP